MSGVNEVGESGQGLLGRRQPGDGAQPDLRPEDPRVVGVVAHVVGVLAGIGIYAVAIVIAIDVASRIWGIGYSWPLEVYPLLTYWAVMVGFGYTAFKEGNVRMDLFVEEGWLGPFQRLQPYVAGLVSIAYLAFITWATILFVGDLHASTRVTPELRTPVWIHALAMPIGLGLIALAVAWRLRWKERLGPGATSRSGAGSGH